MSNRGMQNDGSAHEKERSLSSARTALTIFGVIGAGLIPLKAEGQPVAYWVAGIAFVLGLVLGILVARRYPNLVDAPNPVGLVGVVGIGLIVTSLNLPALETGALGLLAGTAELAP